jgi:hypothetical protein
VPTLISGSVVDIQKVAALLLSVPHNTPIPDGVQIIRGTAGIAAHRPAQLGWRIQCLDER